MCTLTQCERCAEVRQTAALSLASHTPSGVDVPCSTFLQPAHCISDFALRPRVSWFFFFGLYECVVCSVCCWLLGHLRVLGVHLPGNHHYSAAGYVRTRQPLAGKGFINSDWFSFISFCLFFFFLLKLDLFNCQFHIGSFVCTDRTSVCISEPILTGLHLSSVLLVGIFWTWRKFQCCSASKSAISCQAAYYSI